MRPDPLLAHSQRIDREEMLATIRLLERKCTMLEKAIDVLVATLSEVELRGLFVMDRMQMQVKTNSGLVISGQPQVVRQSMLQMYEQERGAFAQELMRREQAAGQAMAQAGTGAGTKDGKDSQAGETGKHTADAPSASDDPDRILNDGDVAPRFKGLVLAKS